MSEITIELKTMHMPFRHTHVLSASSRTTWGCAWIERNGCASTIYDKHVVQLNATVTNVSYIMTVCLVGE